MQDMREKGRAASGERNGARFKRKLSIDAAAQVQKECVAGASYATVAKRFEVSPTLIGVTFRRLANAK